MAKTASTNGKTNGAARSPSIEDLSAQIETLKNDLSELATTFGEVSKAEAGRAAEAAKAQGQAAREMGQEQVARLQAAANDYHGQAETFVKQKPELALGIASGVGFLFGLLLARRS